jgi:hypothetical protein
MRKVSRAGTLILVCSDLQGDVSMGSLGRTLIATALMTGVVAGPAAAATMQATFTGTVTGAFPFLKDDLNVFGAAADPSALAGLVGTITLVFNTANSTFGTSALIGGTVNTNVLNTLSAGGEGYLTLAQVVLNGVTRNLNLAAPTVQASSTVLDYVWDEFDGATDGRADWLYQQQVLTNISEADLFEQEQLFFDPFFDGITSLPIRLDEPFSVDLTEAGWGRTTATFDVLSYNPETLPPGQGIPQTSVQFSGLTLSVICLEDCGDDNGGGGGGGGGPDPSVIPLPASGLLLIGAGAALAALRRRKARAV